MSREPVVGQRVSWQGSGQAYNGDPEDFRAGAAAGPPVVFTTDLTKLQRKVLRLLGMSDAYDF